MDTLPSGAPLNGGFRSTLACFQLSLSCPFRLLHTFPSLRPTRHYPRFWIRRSSSERRRDFNPHEQRAAQHTLLRCPTPQRRACGSCGLGLLPPACCVVHSRHLRGLPVLVHGVSRRAWGLRLRRTDPELALMLLAMLPSALTTASASRLQFFEARYPAHLYPCLRFVVRLTAHHAKLGAEWFAIPFS
jgi:hypothetical protein